MTQGNSRNKQIKKNMQLKFPKKVTPIFEVFDFLEAWAAIRVLGSLSLVSALCASAMYHLEMHKSSEQRMQVGGGRGGY